MYKCSPAKVQTWDYTQVSSNEKDVWKDQFWLLANKRPVVFDMVLLSELDLALLRVHGLKPGRREEGRSFFPLTQKKTSK
jgi:hypothetical protein